MKYSSDLVVLLLLVVILLCLVEGVGDLAISLPPSLFYTKVSDYRGRV